MSHTSEKKILLVVNMHGGTITSVQHNDRSTAVEVIFLEDKKYIDDPEDCFMVGENRNAVIYSHMESEPNLGEDEEFLRNLKETTQKRIDRVIQEPCDECSGTRFPQEKHDKHCSLNTENRGDDHVRHVREVWD